jgi:tRNA(Arg) A34 adenosine deaminase TadA
MADRDPNLDAQFMRRAIAVAARGIETGQTPFGAVIVRDGEVVVEAHNGVWEETDITAHAEVRAIRAACRKLGAVDLDGCTIYSTTEPCPMCFSAIHWANIDRIVYGASIADAARAGFRELSISNEQMKALGPSDLAITPGLLADECAAQFEQWKAAGQAKSY